LSCVRCLIAVSVAEVLRFLRGRRVRQ
jgi:hypothetical protein